MCRHDQGKAEMDAAESRAQQHWDSLDFKGRVNDFAMRHQYGIILGGWALSLGLSFGLIAQNKYQTMPQKVRVSETGRNRSSVLTHLVCRLFRLVCGHRVSLLAC